MHDDALDVVAGARPRSQRWRRVIGGAALCGSLLFAAACSDEAQDRIGDAIGDTDIGGGDAGDGGEAAPAPDPDPEAPPAPEPDPEPETPTEPEPEPEAPIEVEPAPTPDDEMSDEDWLVLALLGLAVLALIIGVTSLAARRSEAKKSAQASLDHRNRQIVGAANWVHDQGSIDVLRVSDPDQIRAVWGTTRAQMIDLEGRIAGLQAGAVDPALSDALRRLGHEAAALRGALESSVSLRLDPDVAAKATLVESATQTVLDRRRDFEVALRPLARAGMETR